MATTSVLRTAAIVLGLAVAPCLGRAAAAQTIRVGAVVTAPAGLIVAWPDSVIAPVSADARRIRIPGAGRVDIHTGPGAEIRIDRTDRLTVGPSDRLRVTIDYAGS